MPASRRTFLRQTGTSLAGLLLTGPALLTAPGCAPAPGSAAARAHIRVALRGAGARTGHLLRGEGAAHLPPPTAERRTEVLIVGGGVSGLAARRALHRAGHADTLLLELEPATGGNAAGGHNVVSAFPWGAHYLPIPDPRDTALLALLRETGTLTGFEAATGAPIYNEFHLCHAPEERLLINGHWQAGLVPETGVPPAEREEMARFFAFIDTQRSARGSDGRDLFAVPLDASSADEAARALDRESFAAWLDRAGYRSAYLRTYLDYCCRDDYGAPTAAVSAWAGLHYFAARKGRAANAEASDVLTWPDGNAFLARHLRAAAPGPILTETLVFRLEPTPDGGVAAWAYDVGTRTTTRVLARRAVLATPLFVSARLLAPHFAAAAAQLAAHPRYHAPWLVANLTVTDLPDAAGAPCSWDNVRHGSASLGYVVATHQALTTAPTPLVLTLYWPLTDAPPADARRAAFGRAPDAWLAQVLAELELYHPGITPLVTAADLWLWGHGMAAPTPGTLWHSGRAALAAPFEERVWLAHTDLSGLSVFEEAFHQGERVARAVAASLPTLAE